METLYKVDSKGVVRQWSVRVQGQHVIVTHGIKGGRLQEKSTLAKPKNIGKINETSSEQQAVLEAEAKWTKQRERECYVKDLSLPPAFVQPMLARDATKVGHQINWAEAQYGQPKLDGVRGLHIPKQLGQVQSRKGTFYRLPHLYEQLERFRLLAGLPSGSRFLDGEVCKLGTPLGKILGACRKHNELTESLDFYVFDVVDSSSYFASRFSDISKTTEETLIREGMPNIKIVPTCRLYKKDLDKHHNRWVKEGYEGLIIREGKSSYAVGERSDSLYKYKKFKEEDFVCVEVKEDKEGNGVLWFYLHNGSDTFGARARGDNASRRYQLEHPEEFVGKTFTVRFFDYTEYGVPQFPVTICERGDS